MPATMPSRPVPTLGTVSSRCSRDEDSSTLSIPFRCESTLVMPDATSFIDSQITDGLPALIALLDTDLRYRYCNSAYRYWFGLEPESLIGRPFKDIVGESVYQAAKPRIEKALQG